MLKKILLISILIIMVFQSTSAFAQGADTILTDMVYGAAIGALLGTAVYVFDDDDFGEKVAYGAAIGVIGGFIYGIADVGSNMSIVEIEKDKVTVNAPTLEIVEKEDVLQRETRMVYTTNVLSFRY